MKRWSVLLFLFLILLVSIVSAAQVEEEVLQQLETQEEVSVIVVLKEKAMDNKIKGISTLQDKKIQIKYPVFKDLRERGYIVKTALKFGADFRVYDKGSRPGVKHAKWIVFAEHESKKFSWSDFSAKNRIAHSTKKNLLIAIMDEEGDITYYEVKWMRP